VTPFGASGEAAAAQPAPVAFATEPPPLPVAAPVPPPTTPPADVEAKTRQWAMWLHLSLLTGLVLPFLLGTSFGGLLGPIAGIAAPVVIWQSKKSELPLLNAHGKNAVNWILSEFLYGFTLLVLYLIGIVIFGVGISWHRSFASGFAGLLIPLALGVLAALCLFLLGVISPIVAAIKAYNGHVWKYPLALSFFK
jgi:hypothetical protein